MKKIVYSYILFFCLFFGVNSVGAVPSNSACNDYGCATCVYKTNNYILTFDVVSDGNGNANVEFSKKEVNTGVSSYINLKTDYTSTNFIDESNNKLKCPAVGYHIINPGGGRSVTEEFTFIYDEKKGEVPLSKDLSSNNGKNISDSAEATPKLSCKYDNDITIISDGHSIKIEGPDKTHINNGDDGAKVEDFLDEDGNLVKTCPKYGVVCGPVMNDPNYKNACNITSEGLVKEGEENEDANDLEEKHSSLSGQKYGDLVCELNPFLKANPNYSSSFETKGGTQLIDFSHCSGTYTGTQEELDYYTSLRMKDIAQYCNNLYSDYSDYKKDDRIDERIDECINFDTFYDQLVTNGVIGDYGEDCGILSQDLKDKIIWVLDIIKIAGPVLAIVLGSLDFIKVIASGDADKELKNAGKRLLYRIIAAILLFIVPILLAWMMDVVLDDGYDSDNPFCNVVDWSETK